MAAQQSVIGSMLLDKGWVPEVLAQTRAEDYTQPYRALYLAIQQLTQEGTAIDAVTVLHQLDGDAAANRKLVMDLLDLTPTAANCKAYMDILLEQAQLSRLRGLGWRWRSARPTMLPVTLPPALPRRWPPAPTRRRSPSRICWGGSMSGMTHRRRSSTCLGG